MTDNHTRFRAMFWDAFHVPELRSPKFAAIWKELEQLNDLIAGPLYSIYEHKQCDYVYKDQKYFANVQGPDDLFDWLTERIKGYGDEFFSETVEGEQEEHDMNVLLYQTDVKMELAELALEILKERSSGNGT